MKVTMITGATGGLGREFCKLYAQDKNNLFLVATNDEKLTLLKEEIEKQGLEKYKNGDYKLGFLNEYGQRISIRVELPRKNGDGTISFITGWMVRPNGHIQLNTPFGGK